MVESPTYVPDEVQLQVADSEGMIDRREEPEVVLEQAINYEVYQLSVADWEGMVNRTSA